MRLFNNVPIQQCAYSEYGVAMGWLRLVGPFKIYVSFAEYSLFYRALLQKRPVILWSLLVAGTPHRSHAYMRYYRVFSTKDVATHVAVCCRVLQHAALWCSVVQCVAVCCSVLQCDCDTQLRAT